MRSIALLMLFFNVYICNAQTITGIIQNTNGVPIENALVCHKNTPTTYTKTNRNGQFTIRGSIGTVMRIAALHYETIPNFTIETSHDLTVILQNDPLLNTDVFHLSFDHIRAGESYSKNELKTDFNLAYSKGFNDGSLGSDRAAIDYTESRDPNGVSIKVRFPKGKLKTADSGIDTRIDLEGVFNNNTFTSDDLYLSYWVKFSSNFEFDKCGGKLPSLGGSTFNSSEDRWKGRIMWRKGGSIQFYMELPDSRFTASDEDRFWGEKTQEGSGICAFEYTPFLSEPGWHNIELHYKFETPGQNDGLFEGWVDGKNFNSINASVFKNYRPKGSSRAGITINTILLSAFLGGSDIEDYAPTEDIFAWFDEFRVATQRVNEWSRYNEQETLSLTERSPNTTPTIVAYPNPNPTGVFKLTQACSWRVYTLLGVEIAKGYSDVIDLNNAAKGTYLLRLKEHMSKLVIA